MKKQFLASEYKYALLAVLLWSSVATAFKIALRSFEPFEMVFYSIIVSNIFFFSLLIKQKKLSSFFQFLNKNKLSIALSSFISPFAYYLILFKAYSLLLAQEAQAINYTWALVLAYLGAIFLKHKLGLKDILAGFICYFGVLLISSKGDLLSLHFSSKLGVFFAILSTLLWASYWIINTKNNFPPIFNLAGNFLFSLVYIILYICFFKDFKMPHLEGILASIYIGLFEMGLTFLLWLKALQVSKKISNISNLIFLSPFISLIFIHFILKEKIYLSTIIWTNYYNFWANYPKI